LVAHSKSQARYRAIDLLSASGRAKIGSGRATNLHRLAVQLTLDPDVLSLELVESLSVAGRDVEIGMLVAQFKQTAVAYDIVDEREYRDLDSEGMLLIALDLHRIARVEVDADTIQAEPRATNSDRIWGHRGLDVGRSLRADIETALSYQRMSIKELGSAIGLNNAFPVVCSLMCRRALVSDLSMKFGPDALIALRGQCFAAAENRPTEFVKPPVAGAKR
jgi:hypothetical protein